MSKSMHCARALEMVVVGPCFVAQCWLGSFFGDELQCKMG